MTTRIAIGLALLILAALWLDAAHNDGAAGLFALRRLAMLIDWLAFWR